MRGMLKVFAWCLLCFPLLAAAAPPKLVGNASFEIEVPDGYRDITEELRATGFPRPQIAFEAESIKLGFRPTVLVQLVPAYGGTLGDAWLCEQGADGIAAETGHVRTATIVEGPAGPTCQMHIVYPQAAALITELNGASESWLMICNYADGDRTAEGVCRDVLASFRPKSSFGRPDPEMLERERILDRVFVPFALLVYRLRRMFGL